MAYREIIGKTIEHYRIDKLLGQGGMAAVFQATDLKLQRQVAIKLMHSHLAAQKSFQERFLYEARAAASLDHPNIVRVLSFDHIGTDLFIVMELVTGGNLRQYVKKLHEEATFMDMAEVVELVRQLADALDYAHRHGMMHRDIKPDNVVLKPLPGATPLAYRPVITDFGLARLTAGDDLAITDQPLGTYPYMSPEQVIAEKVDSRTDIYALGIMLYELSVGRLPFQPRTIAEAARMHVREPVIKPSALRPDFPPDLERVILRSLEKDPNDRYQTAGEMVAALTALQPDTIHSEPIIYVDPDISTDTDSLITVAMPAPLVPEMPHFTRPGRDRKNDRLIIYSQQYPIQIVVVSRSMTLGRGDDQSVILQSDKVSRRHARLERGSDGKLRFTDLGSTNGTWVGAKQLAPHETTVWEADQIVRLGDYWITLEPVYTGSESEPSPDAPPASRVETGLSPIVPPVAAAPLAASLAAPAVPSEPASPLAAQMVPPVDQSPLPVVAESTQSDYPFDFDDVVDNIPTPLSTDTAIEQASVSESLSDSMSFSESSGPDYNMGVENIEIPKDADVSTKIGQSPEREVEVSDSPTWLGEDIGDQPTPVSESAAEEEPASEVLSALPDATLVGRTLSNFRLDRYLGAGGMAAVYMATDLKQDRQVAIKVLLPNLAAQEPIRRGFMEEARIFSTLIHPNIVRVLTYDQQGDDIFYMVMELVTGGSLADYQRSLRDTDRLMPFTEAVDLVQQMADALHYAHQQGLIHRSIKPGNIVLRADTTPDGKERLRPVLTDFGLARLSESQDIFVTDQPGVTFPYMSPEECLGDRVDFRSDIYELGVVLYELSVGRVPFRPRSIAEAIRMHTREPLPKPSGIRPDLPSSLERVIIKSLEKNRDDRYQSAGELSRTLDSIKPQLAQRADGILSAYDEEEALKTTILPRVLPNEIPYHTPQPVPSEQIGLDRLVIFSDGYPTYSIPLDQNVLTVGRGDDQTVKLESKTVSRRHARIERSFGNRYRIVDLGSSNGSWLGDTLLIPNVAESWDASSTVRIGEYWFRLDLVIDRKAYDEEMAALEAAGGIASEFDEDYDEEVVVAPRRAAVPAVVLPAPEHDKVRLNVVNSTVTVAPGSSVTLAVEVTNQSTLVDHFKVEVTGLPQSWVTLPAEPLYLFPNNRDTASITFHPPLASTSSAGAHAFEVRVTARAQGIQSVAEQGALIVLPFRNFLADMQPLRVVGRAKPELVVTNTGNIGDTYTIQARDREQSIRFDVSGKQYTVAPGQMEYVIIRLAPKHRPLIGMGLTLPFEVTITAQEESVPPQTLMGEMVVKSRIPAWIIAALIFLAAICGIIALLAAAQFNRINEQNQTATVVAMVTQSVATATAVAADDPDGDGLSTAEELDPEVGTDPEIADTDEDGLVDGQEVRVWATDPLNRDTDGDNLPDGQEVNELGTSPTNVDTDGDGIPDDQDTTPIIASTFTPTPFPTIVGSNGDICAGSPPTRLAVGMVGAVEGGGLANRLRDNPGISAGAMIGQMPPASQFSIIDGPQCDPDDELRWWFVDFNGLQGWTAEGAGEEYYIAPEGEEGGGGGGDSASTAGATDEEKALVDEVLKELPEPSAAELDRALMGVQIYGTGDTATWQRAVDQADALDTQWIKLQLNWSDVQADGPDMLGPSFETFRSLVQTADARGLRVLISIAKAPNWTRAETYDLAGPPDDPQDLANFITRVLTEVGPNIDAIEVWNEPNLNREWSGALSFDGAGYMQLFAPAHAAIRAYSEDIFIVTAGLAPTSDSDVSVDDRKFLRQMYEAGLAEYTDIVVGIHPYGWGNPPDIRCCDAVDGEGWDDNSRFFFLSNIEDFRSITQENAHDVQLWATEFGWGTWTDLPGDAPEGWMVYNTPDDQLNYTVRAFQIGQALDYMGPMFLWNLNFADSIALEGRHETAAYSLIINDSLVRPLFNALADSA